MPDINSDQKDLKKYFKIVWKQLIEINLLKDDLVYLYPNSEEYHEMIFHSNLLHRLKEGVKIRFSLKLCIILDQDEDFNLISFVKRLLTKQKKAPWHDRITLDELKNYEKELNSIRLSNEFKTILHMRNKVYAHLDKNAEKTDLHTTLEQIIPILLRVNVIFNRIGSAVFNSYYELQSMPWSKDHHILSEISNFYEILDQCKLHKSNCTNTEISISEIEEWTTTY